MIELRLCCLRIIRKSIGEAYSDVEILFRMNMGM